MARGTVTAGENPAETERTLRRYNLRMRRASLPLLLLALSCGLGSACNTGSVDYSGPASPTPTGVDTGDGHDGTLTINSPTVLNVCHHISLLTSAGALTLDSTTGVAAGDRILLVDVQDDLSDPGDFAIDPHRAGQWELGRVASVGSTVQLEAPAVGHYTSSFSGRQAEACTVPEYQDLTISGTGKLIADPWDGATGGVAAVLVKGTLTLTGDVDVSGDGFRGGATPASVTQGSGGDLSFNGGLSSGHGGKGESIDGSVSTTAAGRGANTTGGGGGNPWCSGGGGGSNGGAGGVGGNEHADAGGAANGGFGTQPLLSGGAPFLWMGGAGGAAARGVSGSTTGGAGGGVVLIGAHVVTGNGAIRADGAGGTANTGNDKLGGGGGGAGGSIVLSADSLSGYTGSVSAQGGAGGQVSSDGSGPGGGGGGGRLFAARKPANVLVKGGANGTSGASARGAVAGSDGVSEP